ncbi:MAG: arginine deiminase family protein [Parachlamydiales bacterium]|jgi:arginine deiminase
MDGMIRAEWDPLKKVVVHKPGLEMFFGLLEPYGSLYERAFSRKEAREEHDNLVNILQKEFGIQVYRLKDLVLEAARKRPRVREKLIQLARSTLEYSGDKKTIERAKEEFERSIPYLDTQHFFYILLVNPKIFFKKEPGARNIQQNVNLRQPLSNLYFMRDQQFMTDRGVVVCRLAKPSRRGETRVTRFVMEDVLEMPIAKEITEPGTIEGGEFLPMGKFALVGIGDRTNQEAIDQLLTVDFAFEEIGVVHQPMHPLIQSDKPDPMINMHLDTYFNVAGSHVVVGCEMLLKNALVDIYHNEGGRFLKEKKQLSLSDYMKKKGFEIVNLTTLEQLSYASNFLTIKENRILAVEIERGVKEVLGNLKAKAKKDRVRYGKLYDQACLDFDKLKNEGGFFPHKKELYSKGVEAYPVILKNLTGGFGAAHCMTCALSRG